MNTIPRHMIPIRDLQVGDRVYRDPHSNLMMTVDWIGIDLQNRTIDLVTIVNDQPRMASGLSMDLEVEIAPRS